MAVKQCCRNCHFLAKQKVLGDDQPVVQWEPGERERSRLGSGWDRAFCFKGVWSVGPPNDPLDSELAPKRKDCFFLEVQQGMDFEGDYTG